MNKQPEFSANSVHSHPPPPRIASRPSPISRKWDPWPLSIIVFFTVAILGFAVFIIFCNRHPADLVAADYYEREIQYQTQIDSFQRAREQSSARVSYDAPSNSLRIALPRTSGTQLSAGTIQLYRPSSAKLDRRLNLQLDADGVQKINAASLTPGLWKVRVSWRMAGQDYAMDQAVVIGDHAS
jgi:hypothetical protein